MPRIIKGEPGHPIGPDDMAFSYIDGITPESSQEEAQARFQRPGWLSVQEHIGDKDMVQEFETNIKIGAIYNRMNADYWIRTGKNITDDFFRKEKAMAMAVMKVIRRN